MYNALLPEKLTTKVKFGHFILMAFGTICGGMSAWYSAVELIKAFRNSDNSVSN